MYVRPGSKAVDCGERVKASVAAGEEEDAGVVTAWVTAMATVYEYVYSSFFERNLERELLLMSLLYSV